MCDFQVPPEDYDSITDLVTTEEVHLIFYFLLHKDKRNIPSLWWNQIWIFSKARRDAKDVLLAVMGQADTLARCKLASFSPDLVMIANFFDIWNHNHLHHQYHLDQMCERLSACQRGERGCVRWGCRRLQVCRRWLWRRWLDNVWIAGQCDWRPHPATSCSRSPRGSTQTSPPFCPCFRFIVIVTFQLGSSNLFSSQPLSTSAWVSFPSKIILAFWISLFIPD